MPAETHVEGAPTGRQEVLEIVQNLLADILEKIEPSDVSTTVCSPPHAACTTRLPCKRSTGRKFRSIVERPSG